MPRVVGPSGQELDVDEDLAAQLLMDPEIKLVGDSDSKKSERLASGDATRDEIKDERSSKKELEEIKPKPVPEDDGLSPSRRPRARKSD